jgi:hypothetical protein
MSAPTLNPVEDRILENVRDTLAAISTSNPTTDFFSNVATVKLMDTHPSMLASLTLPAIGIAYAAGTIGTAEFLTINDCELSLEIYLCVPRNNDQWRRDISRLAADVTRALRVDPGRGTTNDSVNAFDTVVGKAEISNQAGDEPFAMAAMAVTVQYRFKNDDPTNAA